MWYSESFGYGDERARTLGEEGVDNDPCWVLKALQLAVLLVYSPGRPCKCQKISCFGNIPVPFLALVWLRFGNIDWWYLSTYLP